MGLRYRWIRRVLWFVFNLLICSCFSLSVCQTAKAQPEPSPAGGDYLHLDDEHDFVSTIGEWLPDEQFEELTVEAWVYFEEFPRPDTFWSIASQANRFNLAISPRGWLGLFVDSDGGIVSGFALGPISADEWVHAVIFCNAGAGGGYSGSGIIDGFSGNLRVSDDSFRIGGIMPTQTRNYFVGENVNLRGYIDEIRVSSILRYSRIPGAFNYEVPEERFETDEDTLCLWHFDEPPIAKRYKDSSGNDYHLWRSGIIATDPYMVESAGKVSITWGKLKQ